MPGATPSLSPDRSWKHGRMMKETRQGRESTERRKEEAGGKQREGERQRGGLPGMESERARESNTEEKEAA